MEIVVNGEPHTTGENQTILGLLESLSLDPARVAVELDFQIVKSDQWAATRLAPGARIEIVQFVGGG